MKHFDLLNAGLTDAAADPLVNRGGEAAVLESHLHELSDRLRMLELRGGSAKALADTRLQIARTLASLGRGSEAWALGRAVFDLFLMADDFESAVDACDVLFQAEQPGSISALGQGIWLAVTCPIDPELSIDLLSHVIDETADDADGAAVAATTALFLADVRAQGKHREDLMFFTTQLLGGVAHRHSGVETPEQLDGWMERLELKEPELFLARLRNVVDCLVQDDWWFDRAALQDRLPLP